MNKQERELLRKAVDEKARERVAKGYGDCDPESLTRRANEAYDLGYDEIGDALSHFRDKIVNPLLGEGWTLERIEQAAINWMKNDK